MRVILQERDVKEIKRSIHGDQLVYDVLEIHGYSIFLNFSKRLLSVGTERWEHLSYMVSG